MIGKTAALIQIPDRRVLTVGAAAKYLGCSSKTLRRWTREKKVPAINMFGRRGYLIEDLERIVDSSRQWVDDSARPKPVLANLKGVS